MTELAPWSGFDALVDGLSDLHRRSQQTAARSVDNILTLRNWLIGAWIIAYEQNGSDRATYGEGLMDALGAAFKARGVRGLSSRNLRNNRQVASTWPRLGIWQTPSAEFTPLLVSPAHWPNATTAPNPALTPNDDLPWQDEAWMTRLRTELSFSHLLEHQSDILPSPPGPSEPLPSPVVGHLIHQAPSSGLCQESAGPQDARSHYLIGALELSRVREPTARAFYELQSLSQRWSVRELKRQRSSQLFERVGLSQDNDAVLALANEGRLVDTPKALIRDPNVLEFLDLPTQAAYSEAALEGALVDHLQAFLLELGGDFAFLGRQYRITVGGRHHFIDLLFFHRRLRCLVAIDLKIGTFGYEDAGQMNFYLNYLHDNVALEGESPPVGLILCADKHAEEVHYATGGLDQQVFVSRYLTQLPSEAQLRAWLTEERELLTRVPMASTTRSDES
jgi:predicted nuclease of restriction endonuclease-like (RecB) superfamily